MVLPCHWNTNKYARFCEEINVPQNLNLIYVDLKIYILIKVAVWIISIGVYPSTTTTPVKIGDQNIQICLFWNQFWVFIWTDSQTSGLCQ